MLSDVERARLYGGADKVAEADRRIAAEVDAWPPLSPSQRDRLRILLRGPAEPVISTPRQRAATRQAA